MKEELQRKVPFIMVIFLGLLTAITPLGTDMYLPSLPTMPAELNTTASQIQLTIGIMTFGVAIGQLIGGPISDMMGRKKPLIIGNLLCVFASIICAQAPSIEILLVARFLQGLTGSISVVIAKAIARDYASGPALTKLFATLMMVNGLAPVIAPLIGGQIVLFATWRFVFWVLAGFSVVLLMGSILFNESLPREQRTTAGLTSSLHTYTYLLKDKAFVGHSLIQFFAFGGFFAYITGSTFVYQNIFGLSAQQFSYIFGINSCGIIIMGAISSKLSNIISDDNLLKGSLLQLLSGSTLFLLSMLFKWPLIPVAIILALTVCTVAIFGAASFSLAMRKHGRIAGSASAVLGFFSMLSTIIVSPLVGIAGNYTGIPMGVIMVSCATMALLCYYTLARENKSA